MSRDEAYRYAGDKIIAELITLKGKERVFDHDMNDKNVKDAFFKVIEFLKRHVV
jgi:hypothetical protein